MNTEILRSACQKLNIEGIRLIDSTIHVKEDFEQRASNKELIAQQLRNVSAVSADEEERLYSFKVHFGLRVVSKDDLEQVVKNNDNSLVLSEITATFNLFYSASEPLLEEEKQEFALQNAIFNAWPYWREFVHSTCNRMGVSPFNVPLLNNKS